jgi:hypothetical protein
MSGWGNQGQGQGHGHGQQAWGQQQGQQKWGQQQGQQGQQGGWGQQGQQGGQQGWGQQGQQGGQQGWGLLVGPIPVDLLAGLVVPILVVLVGVHDLADVQNLNYQVVDRILVDLDPILVDLVGLVGLVDPNLVVLDFPSLTFEKI